MRWQCYLTAQDSVVRQMRQMIVSILVVMSSSRQSTKKGLSKERTVQEIIQTLVIHAQQREELFEIDGSKCALAPVSKREKLTPRTTTAAFKKTFVCSDLSGNDVTSRQREWDDETFVTASSKPPEVPVSSFDALFEIGILTKKTARIRRRTSSSCSLKNNEVTRQIEVMVRRAEHVHDN